LDNKKPATPSQPHRPVAGDSRRNPVAENPKDPHTMKEREFEVGKDESWFANIKNTYDLWLANVKRTYDEYQEVSLDQIRRNQTHFDKMVSDAQQYDNQRQNIANQALQNAVETANMVGKAAIRHDAIATDQQWNPIQQGAADTLTARAVSIDDASLKAIGAAVAVAVSNALNPQPK